MERKPCAVVASCTSTPPHEIIKLILGVHELPEPTKFEDGIIAYPWHIDTKYYTADVNLCSIEKKTLGSEQFAKSVEAVVVHFDSNKNDGLTAVESWLSFLKEFEPEVQILLCDRCHENPSVGVCRVTVQEWCVEQGFELVELNPEIDPEWEEEQDFIETTGIKRVVQAMHAHLWPNLHMKERPQQLSRTVQSVLNGDENVGGERGSVCELVQNLQNVHLDTQDKQEHDATHTGSSVNDTDNGLDELLEDSGGVAGFSSLFEQLHSMKERVQGLPSDQRKACAEQVVMAFWRAIGGDEDEFEGLNESGAKVAQYAGKHLHKYIVMRSEYKEGRIEDALRQGFLDVDNAMLQEESLKDELAGTTAVAIILKDNKLYCANVGDSRAIASVNGNVDVLSLDHKPVNDTEIKRIQAAGGWVEFNRVNGNLALSRALGDFVFKRNEKKTAEEQIVTAYPDVEVRDINPEWEFLVIACDGIWDVMTNEEVVEFVRLRIASRMDPEDICEDLMTRCLAPDCQMGGLGCDNMTVVLVCFLHGKSYEELSARCASVDP